MIFSAGIDGIGIRCWVSATAELSVNVGTSGGFADDLALVSRTQHQMQEKTNIVAKQVDSITRQALTWKLEVEKKIGRPRNA